MNEIEFDMDLGIGCNATKPVQGRAQYIYNPGYAGSTLNPPEPAGVEIFEVHARLSPRSGWIDITLLMSVTHQDEIAQMVLDDMDGLAEAKAEAEYEHRQELAAGF